MGLWSVMLGSAPERAADDARQAMADRAEPAWAGEGGVKFLYNQERGLEYWRELVECTARYLTPRRRPYEPAFCYPPNLIEAAAHAGWSEWCARGKEAAIDAIEQKLVEHETPSKQAAAYEAVWRDVICRTPSPMTCKAPAQTERA